ncbi:MAG: molybdenum cofactor biosynthesis protein MoaE [Planctomycetes bacterium]|nr:molybdenum cofactor biosynthesis protein MoaE [Planctomycetota bacterium]
MQHARSRATLTRDVIRIEKLCAEVAHAEAGAIASFLGIVRAESGPEGEPLEAIDYSGYEPMAAGVLQTIADEAARSWALTAVRVVHRLGVLRVGEASVAVVAASPHRAAAFEAAAAIMERIKADAPIFKREIWRTGRQSWVDSL